MGGNWALLDEIKGLNQKRFADLGEKKKINDFKDMVKLSCAHTVVAHLSQHSRGRRLVTMSFIINGRPA